jgi:hypothetical protein
VCIGTLLHLGYTSAAFELSSRFLYFRGTLEAVDLEEPGNTSWSLELGGGSASIMAPNKSSMAFQQQRGSLQGGALKGSGQGGASGSFHGVSSVGTLRKRLRDLLKSTASSAFGTESLPLATFSMTWLEAHAKPLAVLEVGKLAPEQLAEFLKVIGYRIAQHSIV